MVTVETYLFLKKSFLSQPSDISRTFLADLSPFLTIITNYPAKSRAEYRLKLIQHIDNKAQFYCRKAGDDLYFAIFLPDTRNKVYRRISVDYG